MKLKVIVLLLMFSGLLKPAFSADRKKYQSIQSLATHNFYKIKLESKGGFQGFCMQMLIENNSGDTCFAWVEAGRRLISEDDKQQDIFIVKNAYVIVEPRQKRKFNLFGFCCKSHHASPKAGSKYFIGKMEKKEWQTVACLIDANSYDNSAIQAAVWALSNDHPISAIDKGKDNKNLTLIRTVAEIKHIPLPWYNMDYVKESDNVFSNKPSRIYAEINYTLPYYGVLTIVVRDHFGRIKTILLDDVPKDKGENAYYLELDVVGWKDGLYTLELVEDGNKIIEIRKFEINTQSEY